MLEWIGKYWLEVLFGAVTAGLGAAYGALSKKLKAERAKNAAIESGLRGILRIQILDTYDKCKAEGKITVSRKDAIGAVYQSYTALCDDNRPDDTIKTMYEEIVHMPTR